MKYISEKHLTSMELDWNEMIDQVVIATKLVAEGDFSQPIKLYLRYKDLVNRIIAMPAYIGGNINAAGMKWIASFPENIKKNKRRAHSIIVLNEEDTGAPYAIINTSLISGIRTASVSGAIIKRFLSLKKSGNDIKYNVGIIGFGPIGRLHLEMINTIMGDRIYRYYLYDIRECVFDNLPEILKSKTVILKSWEEVFEMADIFCTCTVAKAPYINIEPKKGSLQLNISLRDYEASFRKHVDIMIVDDWDEVCRENTDIEMMHLNYGLEKRHTINITDFIINDSIDIENKVVMFNPMGMAVYDMTIAKYVYLKSNKTEKGILIED